MKYIMIVVSPIIILFAFVFFIDYATKPSPAKTNDNLTYFMDEKTGICFASYWNMAHSVYGLTSVDCNMVEGHLIDF